jgi:FkbM family methyltransferase
MIEYISAIISLPSMIKGIPRPYISLFRTLKHRITHGNWYAGEMLLVHREFNVTLYARSEDLIFALMLHEPRTYSICKNLVVKGRVTSMLDVGANIGGYSVVLGKKIPVIAMEPMPDTYSLLSLNIKVNRSNVSALRYAAYDGSCSTVELSKSSYQSGSTSINKNKISSASEGTIKAPACTLDSIWNTYGPFDLVKIDVEGSELEVLNGFSKVPKYLVIEVTPCTFRFVKERFPYMNIISKERPIRAMVKDVFNIVMAKE